MERYEAKRAVIIGGTSGMGLATAKMLLDGGARVLVTGRSQAGLESAQQELGKNALVVSSDARCHRHGNPGRLRSARQFLPSAARRASCGGNYGPRDVERCLGCPEHVKALVNHPFGQPIEQPVAERQSKQPGHHPQ
jgi:NAD(P)-dependent dehydrogenase (short-subunit alcohol dehydrogenase family)